ncbi:hypothetical protein PT7_2195 [Pusillimonas sp. T7-7]|nr:hypothetical protein PT7_2195 [Pusillimonas sp. T7-7]
MTMPMKACGSDEATEKTQLHDEEHGELYTSFSVDQGLH